LRQKSNLLTTSISVDRTLRAHVYRAILLRPLSLTHSLPSCFRCEKHTSEMEEKKKMFKFRPRRVSDGEGKKKPDQSGLWLSGARPAVCSCEYFYLSRAENNIASLPFFFWHKFTQHTRRRFGFFFGRSATRRGE
jgi:hypothetical protein